MTSRLFLFIVLIISLYHPVGKIAKRKAASISPLQEAAAGLTKNTIKTTIK
jgi:hypothetical protein